MDRETLRPVVEQLIDNLSRRAMLETFLIENNLEDDYWKWVNSKKETEVMGIITNNFRLTEDLIKEIYREHRTELEQRLKKNKGLWKKIFDFLKK